MNISEWVAAGKPVRRRGTWPNYINTFQCDCDSVLELQHSPTVRAQWFEQCSLCKSNTTRVENLPYLPGQGFAGAGMEKEVAATGAQPIKYVPPPVLPPPQEVPTVSVGPSPASSASSSSTLPLNGGSKTMAVSIEGIVGTITSVCKGPYNFNSSTGMCVPKPDCKVRDPADPCVAYPRIPGIGGGNGGNGGIIGGPGAPGITDPGYGGAGAGPCPTGYFWDGTGCAKEGFVGTVQRGLPGGASGYLEWTPTSTPFGAGYVPVSTSQTRLLCPPGYVLFGNKNGMSPGQEVCMPKGGAPRSLRKWVPGARPLLTGGEMKTLRRAKTLENKVKRAWKAAGSPGKPRPCSTRRKR